MRLIADYYSPLLRRHGSSNLWQLSDSPRRLYIQQTERKTRHVFALTHSRFLLMLGAGPPKRNVPVNRGASRPVRAESGHRRNDIDPSCVDWTMEPDDLRVLGTLPEIAFDSPSEIDVDTENYLLVTSLILCVKDLESANELALLLESTCTSGMYNRYTPCSANSKLLVQQLCLIG